MTKICPKCGSQMKEYEQYHECPVCGYYHEFLL
jgi:rubrerythrin